MRRVTVLLALFTLLAGCFSAAPEESEPASASPELIIDESRPEPVFNDIPDADLGTLAAPDVNATLETPPKLQEGEWWRIELHDLITDTTTEFVRVVARVENDQYVVGMPHEGWWKEAVIFHSPAFGDVGMDLSHRAHDVPFQQVKFPLTEGATWQTAWEAKENVVTAKVKVESPTVAKIAFEGTNCGVFGLVGQCPNPTQGVVLELTYDATMHEVVEAKFPSHTWRVVEHGYGFQGWVTVPRSEHLVFFHGRLGAPAFDFINGGPGAPIETVPVNGGYNRVSFILGAGGVLPGPGGAYSEKATSPDGKVFELTQVPGGPFQVAFFEHNKVDGDWTLEHVAAGPGIVFIEGIAYHQYDIRVPDGAVRADHSHQVVR